MFVRLAAIAALSGLVAFTSVGSAARAPSDATAVITGSGKRYVLTVSNTGALPISCMRFRPKYGVQIVGTNGSSLARNTIGTAGPYPGETSRTRFRTKRPYPARAGASFSSTIRASRTRVSFPGARFA